MIIFWLCKKKDKYRAARRVNWRQPPNHPILYSEWSAAAAAGAGRGHYYTEEHLRDLLRIKTLKENNLSLEKVAEQLRDQNSPETPVYPLPTTWVRIEVNPGIELNIQGGIYPVTPARVRKTAEVHFPVIWHKFNTGEVSDEVAGLLFAAR